MNQTLQDTYNSQITTIRAFIDTDQATHLTADGHYHQHIKSHVVNGITYDFQTEVHEHKFPDGIFGYTYYFSYNDGTNDYMKTVKQDGTTVDWTLVENII